MAVMQRFRGNPEEKKYVLYNNFSGGINTTDIDEVVLTSQFRVLENVELAQRGALQNRKGFQYYDAFNEFMDEIGNPFEAYSRIHFFSTLEDTKNVLELLSKYGSFQEFLDDNPQEFEVMFVLIGVRTYGTLEAVVTRVARLEGSSEVIASFASRNMPRDPLLDRPARITNIEHVNFNNKIYIARGQLNSGLEGFLEISVNEDKTVQFKEISKAQNIHAPNAYEISNIGFNILAESPLDAIEPVYTSAQSIRTFWITKINNFDDSFANTNLDTPLYKIPNNADFILNVLVTGTENLELDDLNIDIYTENADGSKDYIKPLGKGKIVASDRDGDIFRYRISINIEQNKPTFIEVNKKQFADPEITYTFADVSAMLTDFNTRAAHYTLDNSGKFAKINLLQLSSYGYFTPTLTGLTIPSAKFWHSYGQGSLPGFSYWNSQPENNRGSGITPPDPSTLPIGYAWRFPYTENGVGKFLYMRVDERQAEVIPSILLNNALVEEPTAANYPNLVNTWQPVLEDSGNKHVKRFARINSVGGPTYVNSPETSIENLITGDYKEPDLLGLYYITNDNNESDSKYYKWKGTYEGDITDFEEYDVSEEDVVEFTFINVFDVGQDLDLQPIKSIETSNVKMLEHHGRLLIYDKNTMWFSDLYKFDYFPNNNYVILPLRSDDEIVKIAYFRGSYIILTKHTLYRMSGVFGTDEFDITLINNSIGCTSAGSVRNVNNTLVFLTNDGLYLLKQNYFMEGLENVEKVDIQVQDVYPIADNVESILHNEQVLFFIKDAQNKYVKTIKQYYNLPIAKNMFPVSIDKYRTGIDNIFKIGTSLVSHRDDNLYIYGRGYSDFMPPDVEEENRKDYMYKITIITPRYTLGYPTHDKKYKNLYVNTRTERISPLSVTVYVDGYEYINPSQFQATLNKDREIVYTQITNNNIEMRHAALGMNPSEDFVEYYALYDEYGQITGLGSDVLEDEILKPVYNVEDFQVGVDKMGVQEMQTHKLVVSGKGKTVSFKIEHLTDEMIVIHNLGILHKLGKVKEG